MVDSAISMAMPIPGLNHALNKSDLVVSQALFNDLIDSEDITSEISDMHLQSLAEIFVKHGVHTRLGIHLIHNHSKLEHDQVMLGSNLTNPSGTWNKPIAITDVDVTQIHGHVFKLVEGHHFMAYEFVSGRACDLSDISMGFFVELAHYLHLNELEDTLGIQILGANTEKMVELDFADFGTVMLEDNGIYYGEVFRTTGWRFECIDGVIAFKGKESHAATNKGPHKVFIDGKLGFRKDGIRGVLKHFNVIN